MARTGFTLSLLGLLAVQATTAIAQEAPVAEAPAAAEIAPTTTYALSSSKSDLYVILRNDTSATLQRLGHDHVIYASSFEGSVTWPNQAGQACNIDIKVPVTQLTVDPPGLRDAAGLDDNAISDDDKSKVQKNMWGNGQLDASSFSHITFTASSCGGTTGKVPVKGDLTIRGVTKPVELTMDVTADGSSFSARGKMQISHSQFGFKPYAASAFGPRNADPLTLVVRVRGSAK